MKDFIPDIATQRELDQNVLNIELTLISIIQGVALYFLVDAARDLFSKQAYLFLPYFASSLLILLNFWSRSIVHALTLIRWPLEFTHNFLYISATLVEALSFSSLQKPLTWFVYQSLFSFLLWMLFVSDLKLIRLRKQDSPGLNADLLYAQVEKDQWLNIYFLFPLNTLFNVLIAVLFYLYPDYFLGSIHWVIALVQALGSFLYLLYGLRFYQKNVHSIACLHQEWRSKS